MNRQERVIVSLMVVLGVVLLLAVWAYAGPKDFVPPGHRYSGNGGDPSATATSSASAAAIAAASANQHQGQNQYQGQNQQAYGGAAMVGITIPGQNVTVNPSTPLMVAPSTAQTTTINNPAPPANTTAAIVTSSDQKQIPSNLPYPPAMYPPVTPTPGVVETPLPTPQLKAGSQTAYEPNRPWNMASHWSRDTWPMRVIVNPGEIKGVQIIEDIIEQPQPATMFKADKDPMLTIYKGVQPKAKAWKEPHIIGRRVYVATERNMTLFQLQRMAMWWAKELNATGLQVNGESYYLRNTQRGGGITAGMLASALGSILGQNATWGPYAGVNWQSWDGTTDVFPVLDVTAIQVQ